MKRIYILLLAILTLASCSSLKVTSNFDKTIDISKSKTYSYYGWTEVNDMFEVDKTVFEKAFADEFKSRGLTYTETGGDIVISLFLVIDKTSTQNRYNTYYGQGPYGFYQPAWGWGTGYAYNYNTNTTFAGEPYRENVYYQGTLVCDVFDSQSKKLAWQGVISKAIPVEKKNRTDVAKIVQHLLLNFPIKVQPE